MKHLFKKIVSTPAASKYALSALASLLCFAIATWASCRFFFEQAAEPAPIEAYLLLPALALSFLVSFSWNLRRARNYSSKQ